MYQRTNRIESKLTKVNSLNYDVLLHQYYIILEQKIMRILELDKIVSLSAIDSRLLILVMDKGEADMNEVIVKLPPRLAEQRDFRILKVRVTDRVNDPKERCNYNLTDLNDGLSWLLS